MIRRSFISLLGGAAAIGGATAAWPRMSHAQQRVMHVIGTLHPASPMLALKDFRQGLKQEGFVEGQNVAIVTRSADGEFDLLSSLLAEMVQLRAAAIVAFGAAARPVVAASRAGSGAE